MKLLVMERTDWRPLVSSLTAKQWRAALRADFGIRLAATTDRSVLYVAWCEAYQAHNRHAMPASTMPRQVVDCVVDTVLVRGRETNPPETAA